MAKWQNKEDKESAIERKDYFFTLAPFAFALTSFLFGVQGTNGNTILGYIAVGLFFSIVGMIAICRWKEDYPHRQTFLNYIIGFSAAAAIMAMVSYIFFHTIPEQILALVAGAICYIIFIVAACLIKKRLSRLSA